MTQRPVVWGILALILVTAGAVRFSGLDWDDGIGAHPDERYIVSVAEGLRWPDRLNPFVVDTSYAYGHLPVYLLTIAIRLAPAVDALLVGRAIAAAVSVVTVALTFLLARRVYGSTVGLLGASLVGLMVLEVQHAHFFTVDVPLVALCLGSLLFAVRVAGTGRLRDGILAGALMGLATATKVSGIWLGLPVAAAWGMAPLPGRQRLARAAACCGAAALGFAIVSPYAVASWPLFVRNVAYQSAVARGAIEFPFTRQFIGTVPYGYQVVQLVQWGMGWLPGATALVGLVWATVRAIRARASGSELVILAFALPYAASFGGLYAKYPRYLLPLAPLMTIFGAALLVGIRRPGDEDLRAAAASLTTPRRSKVRPWHRTAAWLVVCAALLRCLALARLYEARHPWVEATAWFALEAKAGSIVAVEEWDHPLPGGVSPHEFRVLPIFDEESEEKWVAVTKALVAADYVVLSSRRGYATLGRLPDRYPTTVEYYRLLLAGRLGFEPVACFGREAVLGPISLEDEPTSGLPFTLPDVCRESGVRQSGTGMLTRRMSILFGRIDESLVVYDHPRAIVLRRSGPGLGADELLEMLRSAP